MSDELREEAEATLAARAEVGQVLEPQLVDRFADRVEQEIDRRARVIAVCIAIVLVNLLWATRSR